MKKLQFKVHTMHKLLTMLCLLVVSISQMWGANGDVLFSQDFGSVTGLSYRYTSGTVTETYSYSSSGTTLSGLVGSGTNLFTHFESSIKKGDIAINSQTGGNSVNATGIFQAYSNGDNAGYWSLTRTSDFAATAPTALKVTLDIWYANLSSGSANGVQFAIGDGFTGGLKSTTAESSSNVHSGFAILANSTAKLTAYNTPGTILYSTGITQSAWLSVTWIINNTGSSLTYNNPTGSGTTTLDNDKFDIWVKTQAGAASTYTKFVSAASATTATKNLQEIYIGYNNTGKKHQFRMDNIVVTDLTPSSGFTVSATVNDAEYGSVSPTSLSSIASGTSITPSSNVLTVGASSITATATSQTSQYSYAFDNWTKSDGTALPATVTGDLAVRANFSRTARSYAVTHSLSNVTTSSGTTATYGTDYTATFAASSGYALPSTITVMRGSTNITANCTWVQATGSLTIPGAQNTGAITVTITGEEIGYTLQFDANGGTGTIADITGTGSKTLPSSGYTKAGCTLAGWATSQSNADAGTIDKALGASYTLSADATLYAVWKVNTPAVDASTNVDVYGTTTLFITIPTNAEVRYTTNGDTPTPSSDLYDEDDGIEVTSGITVKAIAVRSNHITSDMLSVPFYQLSLQCLNGTCSPASPYITKNHAYSITTDGTSGYAFRGWTIESGTGSFGSASTASTTFTMTSTGATIKAWWRLQCTITFDNASPSATGGELGRTVYEGENTNLTTDVSIPSLAGATFAGYFTEEDGAGEQLVSETGEWITDVTDYIDADGKWEYDQSSITLYAYWVVGTKTITGAVSPDGYGSISPAFISVTEGSTVSISGNVLTCDGKTLTASPASATSAWTYSFSSWSGVADDDVIDDDVTATANFTRTGKSYTITLDKEGGSGGSSNVSATYGSAMPSPGDAPTKDDYTFGGYYSAVGGGGTQYYTNACASARNSDFTSASTLYAKWTQSISLDSEGGSSGSSSVTATYNSATLGSITNPTKTGYTFAGWYDGDGGTGNMVINTSGVLQSSVSGYTDGSGKWTSSSARTLYAKWNVNSYGVTYAGNGNTGGTVPTDGTSYDYGSDVTVAAGVPTKSGSTFVGWLNSTNNTIYRAGQSFTITAATTLTAQWSTPTVTTYYYGQVKITSSALVVDIPSGSIQFFTNTGGTIASSDAISLTSTPSTSGVYYYSNNLSDSELSKSSNWSSSSSSGRYIRGLKFASGTTYTLALGTKVATSIKFYGWCGSASKTMTVGGQSFTSSSTKNTFETHNFTKSGNFTGNVSITQDGDFYGILVITTSTPSGYNVTFNASGKSATNMPANYSGVPSGKKIAEPAEIPTVSGYIFNDWVTTSGGSTAFDFANTTITADKTIYAKWTAKTQPTQYTLSGDSYYCPSGTATLTLSGSQSGISYQLLKGGSASGDPVDGTGDALEWEVDAAGTYTVKAVENATYSERAMSGEVTVSAAATTAISSGPTTSVSAATGVNFTLGSDMVTAGHGLEYQWYSYTTAGGAGEDDVDGATSATYTTSKSAGTYYYKVKVSGDCGDPVYSNMITVTVKNTPTVYTVSGTTSICSGETATITLADSEDGIEYQLLKGGVAEGDPVDGTGDALEWEVSAAGTYTVKTVETVTYAEATMSGSAVITVNAVTVITTDLATTRSIYANGNYNYTIAATGVGLSYQWYKCNSDGSGKVAIDGKTAATMGYTFSNSDAPTKYICCEVTGTCGTVTSTVMTLTITPTYTLTYNANNGSGAPSAVTIPSGSYTLSSTVPTRSGYRFLGWNTENDGSGTHYAAGASFTMPAEATTLYAEWQEVATITYVLDVTNKGTTLQTLTGTGSSNARITASTSTTLLAGGLGTGGKASDKGTHNGTRTLGINTLSEETSSQYFYVTFSIAENYEFIPASITLKGITIGGNATSYKAVLTDGVREVVGTTSVTSDSEFTLGDWSGLNTTRLVGDVTLKLYGWYTTDGTYNAYRLSTPITISGDVNYICPERSTITSPATTQNIKLFVDQSTTLSVSATAYAGTLNYQWKKDGVNIVGATSASYTVVGSGLTAGTTYAYTCAVSETSPASCATVTSPAFNVTAKTARCGNNIIAGVTLTSSSTGSGEGALYGSCNINTEGLKDGGYKIGSSKYASLTLSSGNYFRNGDIVVVDLAVKNDGDLYIATGTTSPGTALGHIAIASVSTGDNEIVLSNVPANTSSITMHRTQYDGSANTQNHSLKSIKVKRYICPEGIKEFNNGSGDGLWNNTANWVGTTGVGAAVPSADERVNITKPVTVNTTSAVADQVVIYTSGGNTGKLTVDVNGALIVDGTIQLYDGSLKATTVNDVVINTDEDGQGALIFDNPSGALQTQGTVNFYTKSSRIDGKLQWQYVGLPFTTATDEIYGGLYVNRYSETAGSWTVMRYQDDRTINAWEGLAISGDDAGYACMQGTFVATGSKDISLTYSAAAGENLIGNSWTAPIQITALEDEDFGAAEKTIYIFKTGRYKKGGDVGQWHTIPLGTAKEGIEAGSWAGLKVIPAYQGFEVNTESATTLSLDYDKHVRPATNDKTQALQAPVRRDMQDHNIGLMRIRVADTISRTDAYLLEGDNFTVGYDNGWDGNYLPCDGRSAQLYAQTALGKLAVAALPDLEGTVLGFKPGLLNEYTFSFAGDGMGYYLNDLKMQESTLIQEGNTYTFNWEDGDSTNRFIISATPYKMPTGVDEVQGDKVQSDKVRKVLIDDHLYIIRAGKIFDATGGRIK